VDYYIRPISWLELEAFRGLMAVFAEAFDDRDTYLGSAPSDEYVRRLLQQDTFIVLVATAGGEVVGGLAAYELRKFEQERSEIYIYDLAVKEAHRRKGVATRLIEGLRSVARERGAWVIFVQADRGDDPAIRLYESLGSRESVYHFDIPV
jgi:aminoglycoside 3-N-acetyltransferase I